MYEEPLNILFVRSKLVVGTIIIYKTISNNHKLTRLNLMMYIIPVCQHYCYLLALSFTGRNDFVIETN